MEDYRGWTGNLVHYIELYRVLFGKWTFVSYSALGLFTFILGHKKLSKKASPMPHQLRKINFIVIIFAFYDGLRFFKCLSFILLKIDVMSLLKRRTHMLSMAEWLGHGLPTRESFGAGAGVATYVGFTHWSSSHPLVTDLTHSCSSNLIFLLDAGAFYPWTGTSRGKKRCFFLSLSPSFLSVSCSDLLLTPLLIHFPFFPLFFCTFPIFF